MLVVCAMVGAIVGAVSLLLRSVQDSSAYYELARQVASVGLSAAAFCLSVPIGAVLLKTGGWVVAALLWLLWSAPELMVRLVLSVVARMQHKQLPVRSQECLDERQHQQGQGSG